MEEIKEHASRRGEVSPSPSARCVQNDCTQIRFSVQSAFRWTHTHRLRHRILYKYNNVFVCAFCPGSAFLRINFYAAQIPRFIVGIYLFCSFSSSSFSFFYFYFHVFHRSFVPFVCSPLVHLLIQWNGFFSLGPATTELHYYYFIKPV